MNIDLDNDHNKSDRELAENVFAPNDDLRSGMNNNDLVIGGTGTGKTGGYVIPNISREKGSMVVVDTKGCLYDRFKDELAAKGYKIRLIDFVSPERSDGYDPLCFITEHGGRYREKDIEKVSWAIAGESNEGQRKNIYWNESARTVISFLIAYALETKGLEAKMSDVFDAFRILQSETDDESVDSEPYDSVVEMFRKIMDRKRWSNIPLAVTDVFEAVYGVSFDARRFSGSGGSGNHDFDETVAKKTIAARKKISQETPSRQEDSPENFPASSDPEQGRNIVEMVNSGDCFAGLSRNDYKMLQGMPKKDAVADYGEYMKIDLDDEDVDGAASLKNWIKANPDSSSAKYWDMFQNVRSARKTWGCILAFVSSFLKQFAVEENLDMMAAEGRQAVDLGMIGMEKTALFVNVSDSDRSTDTLARVFFMQLLQALMDSADRQPDGRLKIPVRLYLDDFASGVVIEGFDKIISVIRSRNISVSVILQNLTQLTTCYGRSAANTIVTNCDHIIYLGGQDIATAEYIATRADVPISDILSMKNDLACVIERGSIGRFCRKVVPYKDQAVLIPLIRQVGVGEQVTMEIV